MSDTKMQVQLNGIWGSSPADLFAVGNGGTIMHSTDDVTWTAQAAATTADLTAVGGVGKELWVTCASGEILHTTDGGATWKAQRVSMRPLSALWVGSNTDVYAGGDGAIYHSSDGVTWTSEAAPMNVLGLSGRAGGDVFAVGSGGAILHRTEVGWTSEVSPTTVTLRAVWQDDSGEVTAAGAVGTLAVRR